MLKYNPEVETVRGREGERERERERVREKKKREKQREKEKERESEREREKERKREREREREGERCICIYKSVHTYISSHVYTYLCVRQKLEQRELTRCRDELEQAGRERQRLERVAADVVSSSSPPHMTTNDDLVEKLKVSVYSCVYLHYVYVFCIHWIYV